MKAKEAKSIAQNLLATTAEDITYEIGNAIHRESYSLVDGLTDAEIKKVQKELAKLAGFKLGLLGFF
jgi:hypothetical protein|tara:strand:+ start:936 stop:1136 length:201 start_codon:yes stop_codon:yes gene_type:complete